MYGQRVDEWSLEAELLVKSRGKVAASRGRGQTTVLGWAGVAGARDEANENAARRSHGVVAHRVCA